MNYSPSDELDDPELDAAICLLEATKKETDQQRLTNAISGYAVAKIVIGETESAVFRELEARFGLECHLDTLCAVFDVQHGPGQLSLAEVKQALQAADDVLHALISESHRVRAAPEPMRALLAQRYLQLVLADGQVLKAVTELARRSHFRPPFREHVQTQAGMALVTLLQCEPVRHVLCNVVDDAGVGAVRTPRHLTDTSGLLPTARTWRSELFVGQGHCWQLTAALADVLGSTHDTSTGVPAQASVLTDDVAFVPALVARVLALCTSTLRTTVMLQKQWALRQATGQPDPALALQLPSLVMRLLPSLPETADIIGMLRFTCMLCPERCSDVLTFALNLLRAGDAALVHDVTAAVLFCATASAGAHELPIMRAAVQHAGMVRKLLYCLTRRRETLVQHMAALGLVSICSPDLCPATAARTRALVLQEAARVGARLADAMQAMLREPSRTHVQAILLAVRDIGLPEAEHKERSKSR